jgi:hypothetical protein
MYIIRATVVRRVDVETISQRRNYDSDLSDNFYPYGVIIIELEELEVISFSKFIE